MFTKPFKGFLMLATALLVAGGLFSYFAAADTPTVKTTEVQATAIVAPAPTPCPCPNGNCYSSRVQVQKHVDRPNKEVDFRKTFEVNRACPCCPNGQCPNAPCPKKHVEVNIDVKKECGDCAAGECYRTPVRRVIFGRRR